MGFDIVFIREIGVDRVKCALLEWWVPLREVEMLWILHEIRESKRSWGDTYMQYSLNLINVITSRMLIVEQPLDNATLTLFHSFLERLGGSGLRKYDLH